MTDNAISYFAKTRNKLLIGLFVVLAVLAIIYIFGAPEVYERLLPELQDGHIVLRLENEKVAKNEDRIAVLPQNIIMYAILEGKEPMKDEITYFTEETEKIILDGKELPKNRIEKWESYWLNPVIGWIKIESLFKKYDAKGQKDLSFLKYKHRWRFDGYSYWALPADAKPSSIIEYEVQQVTQNTGARFSDPREYPGTMFFQFRAMVYGKDDNLNPITETKTPGKETADENGLGDELTRVTFIEEESFRGYCTGFFNVPYVTGNDELIESTKATERYIAITDKSYVYHAAIQAGYDLKERSLKGLKDACEVAIEDVYLMPNNFVYIGRDTPVQVKFGEGGVRPGDILVVGDERKLVVLYLDGGLESKPDGVLDGADVVLATTKNGLEKEYLANIIEDKFDIWRLVKKSE